MPRFPVGSPSVVAMPSTVYSALGDRALRSGREIFPFHVGDTWMEPAVGCRMEDLRIADHPGMHRYAPVRGIPPLVDALVERTRARTGEAVERSQILLTAGATGGLAAVIGAIVAPGEEVLILAPFWPLIAGIVRTFSGVPVPVRFGITDRTPTAAEVRAALEAALTSRTAAVYLNTPNNPSGRLLPASVLEAIAAFASDHDLWVIADEVYEDFVYEGAHVHTRPFLPDRTFAAYSFSKAYGMAGNRVGYVVGPAAGMVEVGKVGIYAFYSAPTASQLSALAATGPAGDAWVANARTEYRAIGRRTAERLGLEAPEGSTFLFWDVARWLDGRGLDGFLSDCADRGVLLAPGTSFGPFPTHVRLCFTAVAPDVTARGVEILASLLDQSQTPSQAVGATG